MQVGRADGCVSDDDWALGDKHLHAEGLGFGNNRAGANVCNLDVFLASLRTQAPAARVIVLVRKEQAQYAPLLAERFPLHAVLSLPVTEVRIEAILRDNRETDLPDAEPCRSLR